MLTRAMISVPLALASLAGQAFPAFAESEPANAGVLSRNGAILYAAQPGTAQQARVHQASLFAGRAGQSLFAPVARDNSSRSSQRGSAFTSGLIALGGSEAARIRQIIGHAEARRHGYDAVQHGAKIPPPRRPTALSIAEIYQWIADTPGQQHAIGRYQFIPKTLARLVRELGIDERATFTARLQDKLADRLMEEAGFSRFRSGEITRHQFMNNLAKIWAGLPTTSGKSHYHGYAGNRATMSWTQFDAEMARIFPG